LKFLAFKWRGFERLGWLLGEEKTVLGIDREDKGMPQTVMDVIKRGPYARHQIKNAEDSLERLVLDDLEILPPIIPWATFSINSNSSDPDEAKRLSTAEFPTLSLRTPRNHVAHGEVIDIPLRTKTLECEGKLAVVIGRGGRYISPEHALKHIFGYTIYNEGSIKEFQSHSTQYGLGKMYDLTSGFGPAITTEDEVGDIYQQTLEMRIDGNVVHSAPLSNLRHKIEEVIVYISSAITMFPGDVICMSIPTDDCYMPERLLQKDEVVETTITGVGSLTSIVKDEPSEPKTVGCC